MDRAGRDRPPVPRLRHGPDRAGPRGAAPERRPAAQRRPAAVDRGRLRVHGRRAAGHDGHPRRPDRPPPAAADGCGRLRDRLGAGGGGDCAAAARAGPAAGVPRSGGWSAGPGQSRQRRRRDRCWRPRRGPAPGCAPELPARRHDKSDTTRDEENAVTTSKGADAMGEGESDAGSGGTMALPQGDLRLLESDVAKRLLTSSIPARFAYTARDGTPRVVPTWFHWTGDELVMPTFLSAPHVRHAAARLGALRAN